VVSVYKILFVWPVIRRGAELWRIPTSFFYGGSGFALLFDFIMLYRNSNSLEEDHYNGRSADYGWQLLLCCLTLLGLNIPLKAFLHFRPMLICITYLASRLSPNAQINLWGLITVRAIYFPFVMVAMDALMGGPLAAAPALTGVLVGHVWWFLEWKDGTQGRYAWSRAPGFFRGLFGPPVDPAPAPQPRPFGGATAPRGRTFEDGGAPPARDGGYNWGRGERLGS